MQLTVMGGRARIGTKALMAAAGERRTTSVPVGGATRRLALVRPDDPNRAWTWRDVMARLDAVRASAAAVPPRGPAGREAVGAGPLRPSPATPPGTPAITASLDMPGAGSQESGGPPPAGRTVTIPPIEPLLPRPEVAGVDRRSGLPRRCPRRPPGVLPLTRGGGVAERDEVVRQAQARPAAR